MIDKQKDNTTMTRAEVWLETYQISLKNDNVHSAANTADKCLYLFDQRFDIDNSEAKS